MTNVMNDNGPEIIGSLFEKCNNFNYNLRSNGKFLRLSKPNTNSMKRSFSYMGAKTWNQHLNDKYYNSIILLVNITRPYENQYQLIGYRV